MLKKDPVDLFMYSANRSWAPIHHAPGNFLGTRDTTMSKMSEVLTFMEILITLMDVIMN